ncbi:heparin lyase I family protein [Desertivirga xinjiangensis]|uniref:heparin lyase I family protein n=1 Tax=Desertivirga xinjiangensis TaxID=539206 RepID=UPI00210C124F|nr:heparin lyase I family protein [Pedobacter xinjiangensis]
MKTINLLKLKHYAMACAVFVLCSCKESNEKSESVLVLGQVKDVGITSAVETNTSTHKETGFEDGNLSPFTVCTTQNPNYGQAFTKDGVKCMKFYWTQTGFDGTRMDKGAEACSDLNFYKEGWYGFHFYLSSPGFPTNKETAIAQIFAENGCSSWAAMLIVRNNALYLQRRSACVNPTEVLIASDIQRNAWKPVIIHFKASKTGTGLLQVWYAGAGKSSPTYSATNINFAWGVWNGDSLDSSVADNMIKLKFGMYCYDNANYTTNETRVVYFDNVGQLVGNPTNAWETVNPNQ